MFALRQNGGVAGRRSPFVWTPTPTGMASQGLIEGRFVT
jgi:hypothetical protein